MLLLVSEAEIKAIVITVDHIAERLKAAIMVKTSFVLGEHEQPALADENAGQIHCPVAMYGIPSRIEHPCKDENRTEFLDGRLPA
jgi:hypothetical protein